MKYKIELFKGEDGQYYWRIKSTNGNTLATSEGYTTKQSALSVAENLFAELCYSELIDTTKE